MRELVLSLTVFLILLHAHAVSSQEEFPASEVIRGENVWLRTDPAEQTDPLTYLQRGDEVTLTGEAVAADGDMFYPVEVTATGEAGWVRDLFINPRSITPLTAMHN